MTRKLYAFLCLCIAAAFALIFQYTAVQVSQNNVTIPFAPVIIIDAGHGGFDGGAVGVDGCVEKDINLAISKKLCELAELNGFEVIMVREEDIAVYDDPLPYGKSKKVSDIHNRLALTKKYPSAIYISIHQNKFPEESSWGTQIFYGAKNEESKSLAEIIQQEVKAQLQPENNRQIKQAESSLYIMKHSESVSVLVECGFISNQKDNVLLQDDEYQQDLAFVIMTSISKYLNSTNQPI